MTPIIEDSILGSDLDCQFFDLLNVKALIPTPVNLVTTDDPRLNDPRTPALGSVVDASVAAGAAIAQSKLSLDGQIPTAWLGSAPGTAAQGNLAEYLSNKNVPGGYVGLDTTGKVPPALLPATTGTGTVTSVALSMPPQFTVAGSPVTGAGTLATAWAAVPDLSWFGNKSGATGPPQFYTTAFPAALIPALDASQVISGVFPASRLPVAIGLGTSHAPGAVPSPGTTGPGVFATDYLARDMTYKTLPTPTDPAYQPTLPDPTLTQDMSVTNPVSVIVSLVDGGGTDITDQHHVFFYSTTSGSSGFKEFPDSRYVTVPHPTTLYAYVAHPGFNNSAIVSLAV